MSSLHRWLFPVAATLALAAPLSAQWKPAVDQHPAWTASSAVTMPGSDVGLGNGTEERAREASPFVPPAFPGATRQSEDVALMIVGGAALVIGSVIDGDAGTLMMVGGGVMGLLGLYRYLS